MWIKSQSGPFTFSQLHGRYCLKFDNWGSKPLTLRWNIKGIQSLSFVNMNKVNEILDHSTGLLLYMWVRILWQKSQFSKRILTPNGSRQNSPYFLFQNAAGTGEQQEEQKIQQKLVNLQAMQISYITVLKSLMALHNYISQVRNMLPIFIHAYKNCG